MTASNVAREADSVLQPALNLDRDRNTTVFGRRYSPQAYPYGLPPDFTPCVAPKDLSQAPTFEGQLPPYADYPLQEEDEGDTHLGPLLHLKDPSPPHLAFCTFGKNFKKKTKQEKNPETLKRNKQTQKQLHIS